MTRFFIRAVLAVLSITAAHAATCFTDSLSTYLNSGNPFACTEPSGTVTFNFNILPSYVGLDLLSTSNSAANPDNITVVPGAAGLRFESGEFSESSTLLSSQAELVHFFFESNTPILGTTFYLENPFTSAGTLGLGTGLAIGQELVCVGGTFTSLPVGLITTVANGVLAPGAFGCTGVAYIGTVASSAGPLDAITSILGLPNLTGVSAEAQILFGATNQTQLDIIKIQALLTVLGGTASTTAFGNTFAVEEPAGVPEPGSAGLSLIGTVALLLVALVQRRTRAPATPTLGRR